MRCLYEVALQSSRKLGPVICANEEFGAEFIIPFVAPSYVEQ